MEEEEEEEGLLGGEVEGLLEVRGREGRDFGGAVEGEVARSSFISREFVFY